MTGIEILGTGSYAPERIVTNEDLATLVDTSDEWIKSRTGMSRRHFASAAEPTWYLGAMAAKRALKAAGLNAADIDMIVVTTVTPDYLTPSVSCLIQLEIGADNAFAMDLNVACSAFVYAVDMARRYLAAGDVRNVLIVSAETLTQITDYSDRSTCVLFGDGAGACVVKAADRKFSSHLGSDAKGAHTLFAKRTRKDTPFVDNSDASRDPFPSLKPEVLFMDGREVYKFATRVMSAAVKRACEKIGATVGDLSMIIPHQANFRIIETAAKNIGLPLEKIYVNIQDYGNTSSASVAIGLDECARGSLVKRGDLLCLVGFGAGLTYGAAVFEY